MSNFGRRFIEKQSFSLFLETFVTPCTTIPVVHLFQVESWARVTPRRHGFPTGSPVSSQLLKHACRWIGGSKWIQVWTCVCGALWWIGTPSSVYSRFTPSVPEIYGGSSATLTRIKHVAKMNEWNFGMFNWIDPHFYFLGQGHASHLNQQPWNVFTALLRSYNATTQTHFRRLCFACTVFL